MNLKYEDYKEMIKKGILPKDFDKWDLADDKGWTIAHEAVSKGILPEEVLPKVYKLADNDGYTVMHEWAKHRAPPIF